MIRIIFSNGCSNKPKTKEREEKIWIMIKIMKQPCSLQK